MSRTHKDTKYYKEKYNVYSVPREFKRARRKSDRRCLHAHLRHVLKDGKEYIFQDRGPGFDLFTYW
jgi:hypothetical protein